jgi:hypothetical protein
LDNGGTTLVLAGIRPKVEAVTVGVHALRRFPLGRLDASKRGVFRCIEVRKETTP